MTAVTETDGITDEVARQLLRRALSDDFDRFADQLASCGYCSRPVRLRGASTTIDSETGEVLSAYDSASEPDGITYLRCGNRRAAACPSCSHEYKGDMWHLLAAGAGGGLKGVPESVGLHPQVFATITAPSFGPVHTTRRDTSGNSRCHPHRRGAWLCGHGQPTWCDNTHAEDDKRLGSPICAECYDYASHVIWQWFAPELWRRFTIALQRELAAYLGVARSRLRDLARISFAKVAEFQRRGIVHFHAIIRLDGPTTSDERYPYPVVTVDADQLGDLVRAAAAKVALDAQPTFCGDVTRRLRFGAQLDVLPVRLSAGSDDALELNPRRVAGYIAKYATKACEDFGIPSGITGPEMARSLGVGDHAVRIIATAARIAEEAQDAAYDGLERWLHMLGFRGHFATKSRRYSITLTRLRAARQQHRVARSRGSDVDAVSASFDETAEDDTTLVVGNWAFVGIGWLTAGDAALAAESAALAREYAEQRRHPQAHQR
jgi:hypothetical protein